MWDLLIPIMIILVVLPMAVRLAVYSCGYSGYEWYSSDDVLADFYCYYKSYLFDIIGILSAIILIFRLTLYREKTKNLRIFLPLAVYTIFVLLSTFCSINTEASLKGNFESFESVIVLIVVDFLYLHCYTPFIVHIYYILLIKYFFMQSATSLAEYFSERQFFT